MLESPPARRSIHRSETSTERLAAAHADPQLAAALKAMTARLTDGAFAKVGKGNAVMLAQQARRAELERRRDELRKNIDKLDQELNELNAAGKP